MPLEDDEWHAGPSETRVKIPLLISAGYENNQPKPMRTVHDKDK